MPDDVCGRDDTNPSINPLRPGDAYMVGVAPTVA